MLNLNAGGGLVLPQLNMPGFIDFPSEEWIMGGLGEGVGQGQEEVGRTVEGKKKEKRKVLGIWYPIECLMR